MAQTDTSDTAVPPRSESEPPAPRRRRRSVFDYARERARATGDYTFPSRAPIVGDEHRGKWIAWSADLQTIVAADESLEVCQRNAELATEDMPSYEFIPTQ